MLVLPMTIDGVKQNGGCAMRKQQGFSLIELAIVLVIAGLLMSGVLRGQEWIANAKVKSLAADFRNIPTYFYGYQDRFRVLPGDDDGAVSHVNGTDASQSQNGLIEGAWNTTTATDEAYLVWQHLRLAGLMSGATSPAAASYLPRNSEGGRIGVTSADAVNEMDNATLVGAHAMCSEGVMGRYATQLDTMLDDGAGNSGAMRILKKSATKSVGESTVNNAESYLVCMSF